MQANPKTIIPPVNALKRIDKFSKNALEEVKKPRQKKKKRLIVRNLSFKVEQDELKSIFSKFGAVKEVIIPLKEDGKKRGFGFVEFEDTRSLINAMKSMNWKEIHGRKVAVDFAVDKDTYQSKVKSMKQEKEEMETNSPVKTEAEIKLEPSSEEESDSKDDEERKLNNFLKDFYSGAEKLTSTKKQQDASLEESSSDEDSETEDSDAEDDSPPPKKRVKVESDDDSTTKEVRKKKESRDIGERKTVFLRNVSFATTEESLREVLEEYGDCEYCLLCMDQYTDHPKGTAFVKFKEQESAENLIRASMGEPGVLVEGRKLMCSYAMSREDVSHVGEDTKKPKDKRNLYLLRVGLIMPNSQESEGVSPSDMAKRAQLEMAKKLKLKNVNFFVSNKRLMLHNLPKTYTDEKLRKLLKKAAGNGAVITEARVMKEFRKVDVSGNPLSKGYGFATFKNHEDALKTLNELNNNPKIFTSLKRPIVEFSVENKVALLSQERRKEKMQMRNKRRTDEKKDRLSNQSVSSADKDVTVVQKKNKRRKRKNKESKSIEMNKDSIVETKQCSTKEFSPNKQNKNKKGKRRNKHVISTEMSTVNVVESKEPLTEDISPNKKAKNKKRKQKIKQRKHVEVNANNVNETKDTSIEKSSPSKQRKKKNKKPRNSSPEKKLANGKSQQNMTNLVNKFKNKLMNKVK